MQIPRHRVEVTRPDRFRPVHCPWPRCSRHRVNRGFRYRRLQRGYTRACDPRREVPRYRCETCGRGFSRQTFACTYYMKRPELLQPIAAGLVAGSAHRQIARSLGCAPSTVTRIAARIGRHSLLLQALSLGELGSLGEPVVLDHFETFVFSQDDRLAIATAVGKESWFVYAMDPAPHRRAGKRSSRKKQVAGPLPEPIPGSFVSSTRRVLRILNRAAPEGFTLITDKHVAYPVAIGLETSERIRILHAAHANPLRGPGGDPAAARERDTALFAVDLLHKIWRHSQAHHRRETIAFGRRSNAVLERAALLMVWRNLVKGVSERRNDPTTPAMRLGLLRRPLSWRRVFARRLFPGRLTLPEGWMRIYRRLWTTPAVGRNLRHDLRHAF